MQLLFSATKGVVAVLVSHLAQRGVLDLDAPVAAYWPEFGAAGKGLWEPGTRHGYHALTCGWILGEIVGRVTGRSLGRVLNEEVAGPLGLDLWIGLPEKEEERVAPLLPPPEPTPEEAEMLGEMLAPGGLCWRALTVNGCLNLADLADVYNRREMRAAEVPAANGMTTASSLSRLYAACIGKIDGVRHFEPETMERARAEAVRGTDAVWGFETAFGLGFWLHTDLHPKLGPGSFGHSGPGTLGFADPESGVALGYVVNRVGPLGDDPRWANLLDAVRTARRI